MSEARASLLCFEFGSIARGYRALDVATRCPGTKIIDASPTGGGKFGLLIQGEGRSLESCSAQLLSSFGGSLAVAQRPDVLDHELVQREAVLLLNALYSLPQIPLDEALIVVECATLSGLMASADLLLGIHKLKCLELKIIRSTGGAYGFFTGTIESSAPAAEDVRVRLRNSLREGTVELIERPTTNFRSYFNLTGNP